MIFLDFVDFEGSSSSCSQLVSENVALYVLGMLVASVFMDCDALALIFLDFHGLAWITWIFVDCPGLSWIFVDFKDLRLLSSSW